MARWPRVILILGVLAPLCLTMQAQTASEPEVAPSQVIIDADTFQVDDENNTVTAEGNVQAEYEGRILRADKLVYNRTTDRVRAVGNVIIIDPDGSERFADEIETNSDLNDGFAIGFSTRLAGGGTAIAESAIRSQDGINALEKVTYTACELCEGDTRPTWALRARRAILDEQDQMYSYRDAVLEIAGIPVFYLPFFAHPDPNSDRRSGLLIPDAGVSTKFGAFYQQPYYWAISPSQDLTIAPLISTGINPLLEFDYRKRFWSGDVVANFSFTHEKDFDADGERFGEAEWRGHLFAEGQFDINQVWSWGFGIEQMSDDLYTRRYDIDGENEDRGLYAGQPRQLLNQLYIQGQDQNWYADGSLIGLEGLRERDNDATFPTALPFAFAERLFDFGDFGTLAVNGSSAILERDEGVNSGRVSVGADWRKQYVLPAGVLIEPFADARYDYYDLSGTESDENSFERGQAQIGAQISYPLLRQGRSVDILIEPIAMVAAGTQVNNDASIPVEDGLFYEYDETVLFQPNGYGNYDLYEGGAKASIGLSTTARWKNGVSITALGGRHWRDYADPYFTVGSNLDGTVSDWVGSISANFNDILTIETRLRLDEEDFAVNRVDTRLGLDWWRFDASVRYYKLSEDILTTGRDDEGVDIRGEFQVTDRFYFLYGRARDISGRITPNGNTFPGRDLRHQFGVAYEDDCSRFELIYEQRDSNDRTLGPSEAVRFRFSLLTLGDFGSRDVD
ncbi:MAG: LPS assembly protein LptD [Pseudomonadota bacterium]